MAGGSPEGARAYTWRAPRWLPGGLVVGAILWGAGIWWMVANLGGGIVPSVQSDQAVTDEVAVLRAKVDSLTQQTVTLTTDRDALAKRVGMIEARLAQASASASADEAALPASVVVPMNLDVTPAEYSIPRFAYRGSAAPSVTPTTAGVASNAAAALTSTPASRFFTNGTDKYNCTSFTSQAEAQEALAANAPGDPNRMDMNANGVACEDIPYAVNTPRNVTPIANR